MQGWRLIALTGVAGVVVATCPFWLAIGYELATRPEPQPLAGKLLADESSTVMAAQAKAEAGRAIAHLNDVGQVQAFADFTRPDGGYIRGETYVFCVDQAGTILAHGGNPSLVGRALLNLKDPAGKQPVEDIVRFASERGEGWIEYNWPRPSTKRIEVKTSNVIKTDGIVCGVDYYGGRSP